LVDALRRLSVRQRAVVYLTYWIGLDASDIARGLDISVRTVQRELSAARRRLEVLLR
jgi:RNA polymerase sigma factor (sigma-70 family)